ncbi:MAG: hypothetical protein JWQ38_2028 [Flavipsychrobacter sp.]|nr:hypothetical protein [Flavipsychrobacter sp.]
MKLIVITPETDVADETMLVNSLFNNGLQKLHLRKMGYAEQDYRNYIGRIEAQYHTRIVIHACFELATELHLGGVHLNSMVRESEHMNTQLKDIASDKISTSFHSWNEIADNEFLYSYVFISPVFDSISKEGYKAAIDLDGAVEIKQQLATQGKHYPEIIGLGGVGIPQLKILSEKGFDGAAMLGSIWLSADPVKMFADALSASK